MFRSWFRVSVRFSTKPSLLRVWNRSMRTFDSVSRKREQLKWESCLRSALWKNEYQTRIPGQIHLIGSGRLKHKGVGLYRKMDISWLKAWWWWERIGKRQMPKNDQERRPFWHKVVLQVLIQKASDKNAVNTKTGETN